MSFVRCSLFCCLWLVVGSWLLVVCSLFEACGLFAVFAVCRLCWLLLVVCCIVYVVCGG